MTIKVLVTGQVGLEKGEYLREVQEIANQASKQFHFETIGQRMIDIHNGKIDDKTILNLPKVLLDLLRRSAWKEVLSTGESKSPNGIFVINTHAVFRWHHGMFPAIDLDLIAEFSPDIVVVLIDDIDIVKRNLINRETDFFELWELLAWREEEIWLTKFLVDSLHKLHQNTDVPKFFLIPKSQGPTLLYRIITEPTVPKVYISFPITGLPPEEKPSVEQFKQDILSKFIGFDPYSLSERSIVTTAFSLSDEINEAFAPIIKSVNDLSAELEQEKLRWAPFWDEWSAFGLTQFKSGQSNLKGREVLSLIEAIDSQIISRDFLLIDQSDFVLMHIRIGADGIPQISAGCQSEMVYAYSRGKPIYVVCAGGRRILSPWVTQFSEVFETLEQAFEFLSGRYQLS